MQGYDIDTLVALKNSFQATEFQWIKTTDPLKMGKIITVRDVVPGRGGRFIALLSDGSHLDTDNVASDLMMITADQPPMTLEQVRSINYIPTLSDGLEISPDIPQEYINDIKPEISSPNKPVSTSNISTPIVQNKVMVDPNDLFGMFSLEETTLNLAVKIKLPSKTLLKMMYQNSKNKDEFLTKLSNYINSNVTIDSIKKTMKSSLGGTAKSKDEKLNE